MVPAGSARLIFGVNLEVVTFQSIAFMPSMPTVHLDLSSVAEWARWWVDLNSLLKAALGDFAGLFSKGALAAWITGLMDDLHVPTANLYWVQYVAIVLFACVFSPWWMRRLGVKKTSADQAAFVQLAYEAAAMFVIKKLTGGLICTDYSTTHFVAMQNITVGVNESIEAGQPVYMTADGFSIAIADVA